LNYKDIWYCTKPVLALWNKRPPYWNNSTSPVCGKRTAAILNLYFWFRLWPRHRHLILHWHTKFRINRTVRSLAMTLCQFSRWRTSAMLYFLYGIAGAPTTCRRCFEFRHQILYWLDIWFGDIAIFKFWQFALKMPLTPPLVGFWGHISPNDVTHQPNPLLLV